MVNVNHKRRIIKLREIHLTDNNAYYYPDSNKLTQMLKKMYKVASHYLSIPDITKIDSYNPQDTHKLLIKIRRNKQLWRNY